MTDEGIQADLPEAEEENKLFIRSNERITQFPKVPPEPSAYLKGNSYSRGWILQDGRDVPEKGTEMRTSFKTPTAPKPSVGIRKRMLTDFFWEQMLEEVLQEMTVSKPVSEYCTEYYANYIKENFEPRSLEHTADKNTHIQYPLYGTGSSAVTFYSETIKKIGKYEILEKFRKTQDFTKPMGERLDDGWVL